jgi:hypothetical protein
MNTSITISQIQNRWTTPSAYRSALGHAHTDLGPTIGVLTWSCCSHAASTAVPAPSRSEDSTCLLCARMAVQQMTEALASLSQAEAQAITLDGRLWRLQVRLASRG